MLRFSFFSPAIFIAVFLATGNNVKAQQQNKPAAVTASNPTVNQVKGAYNAGVQTSQVRIWEPMGSFTSEYDLLNAGYLDVKQTTSYVDGLGRPLQTVNRQITPLGKDLVTPVTYDDFGREIYKYLPFASLEDNGKFKTDPFNAQQTFMQSQYSGEKVFYNKTEYEPSPLNRVKKIMSPGNSWAGAGRGVTLNYMFNSNADDVKIWHIDNELFYYDDNKDYRNIPYDYYEERYAASQLYKKVTIDEEGNAQVEYVNREGQILLRKVQVGSIAPDYSGYAGFLCTYYVYDKFGRLRWVIPPNAVELNIGNTFNWVIPGNVCYQYEYDHRNRLIGKKVPDQDWVYMIYDTRDRPVFTQDGNLRKKGQWNAILYDKLNRKIMTGIMSGYTGSGADLQQTVTNQTIDGAPEQPINGPSKPVPSDWPDDIILPVPNEAPLPAYSGTYQAIHSITLGPGFISGLNFTAEVFSGGGSNDGAEGMLVNKNPIPPNATFIALTKTYYDSYSSWTNKTFDASYNSLMDAGSNRNVVNMPAQAYTKTKGLVTGSMVRMIGDPDDLAGGSWLTTVNFYDDRNRVIQSYKETQKGTEVITNQFTFTGAVVCSYVDHNNPTGTPARVKVKSTMKYDHAGRLLEVWKTIDDDNSRKALVGKYEYDELGQQKNRQLGHKKEDDGSYTAATYDPVETLTYDYNLRGWITGINKEFAKGQTSPNGATPKFGMELCYDNGFDKIQYSGNIAGIKWRSAGDNVQRAYGFTYDKSNRLLGADFSQNGQNGYTDDPIVNFDMQIGDGIDVTKAYDANGNILAMKQWGLKLGNSVVIDDLEYKYYSNGNKLQSVKDKAKDAGGVAGGNWGLGDFTDKNKDNDDYGYDANGNLITDLNKKLKGSTGQRIEAGGAITYNFLNRPWKVVVKNDDDQTERGNITYIYDAAGNTQKKVLFEKDKKVNYKGTDYTSDVTTTTSYVNGFVYESRDYIDADLPELEYTDMLQFLGQEEGRIRYVAAKDGNPAAFEFDYLVKDHLGNVRMVLTEERKTDIYQAGMELAKRSTEVELFGNKINTTEKNKSDLQGGFDNDDENQKVSQVNGSTEEGRVGPGVILKVMAGDKIKARTWAWYKSDGMDNNPNPGLTSVIANILGQLTPAMSKVVHGAMTGEVTNSLLQPGMLSLLGTQNQTSGAPKAYLNWVLLDEKQFKMIDGGAEPVPVINSGGKQLLQVRNGDEIEMTQNGYLYVFVSNESKGNVYFDDIRVEHIRGAMLEETHYYPFGLTMTGISSKALKQGMPENKLQYNGIEQNTALDLNMYDAFYRNLDPQLGRFWQVDPELEKAEMISPYAAMNNNPILYSDPLGDVIRNGHDEEVELATDKLQKARDRFDEQMLRHGLMNRGIGKKDFLASGRTKDDWKEFRSSRNGMESAQERLTHALHNQFEAREDINQLRHENPTLYNVVDNLPIDVYIGRTNNSIVTTDAGGGANVYGLNAAGVIVGRRFNLEDLVGNGQPVFRPGMAIWVQNGHRQYATLLHELGHTASMYGGVPGTNVQGIPYGTLNNPVDVNDYIRNFARSWGSGCTECRETPRNCNPTAAAAVAAEGLRMESATHYNRAVNPH